MRRINTNPNNGNDDCSLACRCKWLARMFYTVVTSILLVVTLVSISACHATVGLDDETTVTVEKVRADIKELKSELQELRKAIEIAGNASMTTRGAIIDLLDRVDYGIKLLGGKVKKKKED